MQGRGFINLRATLGSPQSCPGLLSKPGWKFTRLGWGSLSCQGDPGCGPQGLPQTPKGRRAGQGGSICFDGEAPLQARSPFEVCSGHPWALPNCKESRLASPLAMWPHRCRLISLGLHQVICQLGLTVVLAS